MSAPQATSSTGSVQWTSIEKVPEGKVWENKAIRRVETKYPVIATWHRSLIGGECEYQILISTYRDAGATIAVSAADQDGKNFFAVGEINPTREGLISVVQSVADSIRIKMSHYLSTIQEKNPKKETFFKSRAFLVLGRSLTEEQKKALQAVSEQLSKQTTTLHHLPLPAEIQDEDKFVITDDRFYYCKGQLERHIPPSKNSECTVM